MTDVSTQVRLAALEANVTSLSAYCTYLQTLVILNGKATLEGLDVVRKEVERGNARISQVQQWMDDLDDDMETWADG